ncbi:hypothetical protein [Litorimonas sp. WD9-15]|uniref:hypothetical protein n=1 Tax=Litorimonas sp. WD9-15 TaxID=3418716 RepID=UPI003D08C50E
MLNGDMDLHSLIIKFRDFIALNWERILELDTQDESDALLIDWLQVNWEMLVERQIPNPKIILEIYGDGADNGRSSRIQFADALPTHRVLLKSKNRSLVFDHLNKKNVEIDEAPLTLDRFVSMRPDGWYYEEPPFDKALSFINGKEVVFNINDVEFILGHIVD